MRTRYYSILLLVASLVTLAFAVLSAVEDSYLREWRVLQRQYAAKVQGKSPFDEALRQYYLPELNRIDRCTTCHTGLLNQDMAGAEQPFTVHPDQYLSVHQPQQYGCTICHAGQGMATNSREAHANGPHEHAFWDEPIHSKDYVQSSCRTCHASAWAGEHGAPLLARGAALFVSMGCNSCHKTGGVGGSRGPALDGLGSQPRAHFPMAHLDEPRTIEHWQEAHLKDPQTVVPGSKMRHYGFSDEQAHALGIYLLSLRDVHVPDPMIHSRDTFDRDNPDGRILYQRYCSGCHGNGIKDRKDKVLMRRIPAILDPKMLAAAGPDFIRQTILHGREGTPMESMGPDSSGLSQSELDALVGYIFSHAAPEPPEPWVYDDEIDLEDGRDLFDDTCKNCHGEHGEGGKDGVSLTSSVLSAMPTEFLAITVRDGRPGTSMNSFREEAEFETYEIADVVGYVRELQKQAQQRRSGK